MKRKALSLLLALVMCLSLLPAAAFGANSRNDGYFGEADGMVWSFDQATGTLTIGGAMTPVLQPQVGYTFYNYPWYQGKWENEVISVVFQDGITKLPDANMALVLDNGFSDCDNLTSVTLPGSIVSIGQYAFSDCESLAHVTISDGVTSIGSNAFAHCDALTEITLPDSLTSLGDEAFAGAATA